MSSKRVLQNTMLPAPMIATFIVFLQFKMGVSGLPYLERGTGTRQLHKKVKKAEGGRGAVGRNVCR
jgi:hypothetical protein